MFNEITFRLKEREKSRILLEFYSLVRGFEETVVASYLTEKIVNLTDLPIFEKYDDLWTRYATYFNSRSTFVKADPHAFYKYIKGEYSSIVDE